MSNKQKHFFCKFVYDWKISYINKGCEFVTDNFTYACLSYNLIFHFIFISALQ